MTTFFQDIENSIKFTPENRNVKSIYFVDSDIRLRSCLLIRYCPAALVNTRPTKNLLSSAMVKYFT
jgi:hypothetical protein